MGLLLAIIQCFSNLSKLTVCFLILCEFNNYMVWVPGPETFASFHNEYFWPTSHKAFYDRRLQSHPRIDCIVTPSNFRLQSHPHQISEILSSEIILSGYWSTRYFINMKKKKMGKRHWSKTINIGLDSGLSNGRQHRNWQEQADSNSIGSRGSTCQQVWPPPRSATNTKWKSETNPVQLRIYWWQLWPPGASKRAPTSCWLPPKPST